MSAGSREVKSAYAVLSYTTIQNELCVVNAGDHLTKTLHLAYLPFNPRSDFFNPFAVISLHKHHCRCTVTSMVR